MEITKAVITAAGRGARQSHAFETVHKAMQPIVDSDGLTKPVLQVIAEEALDSGIQDLCIVIAPDDEAIYRNHFRSYASHLRSMARSVERAEEQALRIEDLNRRICFVHQPEALGYGHAVWCARKFAGEAPFLLLLGDHVYVSGESRRCARQLIDLAKAEGCPVSAVKATREHLINQYGTVAGKRVPGSRDVYAIEKILEKPSPTLAERELYVPGLPAGHYLCFFGMHVLTREVFELIEEDIARPAEGEPIQLTTALDKLARRQKYLALEAKGERHNLGLKFGMLDAQISLALAGETDRVAILAHLLELVVRFQQGKTA